MLCNGTPKGHITEIHAPQYFRDMPNGLFHLLIEQWVERNHQDGKKIEAHRKHISNLGKKMNSIAQRKHTIKHPEIQDRISRLFTDTNEGKYVEKKAGENCSF